MHRILHLIDTGGPGGGETVLANLAEGLAAHGWESRVIVPREDWLHTRLRDRGISAHILPSSGSGDVRFLLSTLREIRSFRPDLVHAHFLGSGVYGSLAASAAGNLPLVCTFHGIPDVDPRDRLLPLKARILSRSRNRIVYVSHHLRRHLEPILGVPAELGLVIHNGVGFSSGDDGGSPGLGRELGLGPGDLLVGSVGNVRPAKDYPNLLRAARRVCDARGDVHFAIVGEGRGRLQEEVVALRRELGLEGRVHLLGFRPDAASLMQGFDLFVSSSEIEGLPLASVEAMARGKPVVLTRCGGVPEVVEDGRTGLLVPVKDPGALAAAILLLLGDAGLRARLGEEARERARARFSLSAMVESYHRLYGTLIRPGAAAHA